MTTTYTPRHVIAAVLEAASIVALGVLLSQAFFGESEVALDPIAFKVGLLSALACLVMPGVARRIPWPLVAYVAAVVLSAAMHGGLWSAPAGRPPSDAVPPYPVVVALLAFGVAYLLRSPLRLGVGVFGVIAAILVLASEILYDRVRTGMVFERGGATDDLALVRQWAGLHQTGWLLAILLPLLLSVALLGRSTTQRVGGGLLAMYVVAVGFINGSRTGVTVMAVTTVTMMLAVLFRRGTTARARIVVVAMFVVVVAAAAAGEIINRRDGPIALTIKILTNNSEMPFAERITGDRWPIWKAASAVIRDHPLGVGIGRYHPVMQDEGYADRYLPNHRVVPQSGAFQAHNSVLQAGVELGIVGGVCFLVLWLWMVRTAWRSWQAGWLPVVACGLTGAAAACFLRLLADSFLDGVPAYERARVVVALVFGLVIALGRTMQRPSHAL